MKSIGGSLLTHLATNVTTLATCWKVTAQDGTVLGFTNHTEDIVVSGITYRSPSGYTPTNIQTTAGLEIDNLDARAIMLASGLIKTELLNGKWDRAILEFFLVNYADPSMGIVKLRKGFLGEIKLGRNDIEAEIRGLMDRYQTEVVELYSQSCRADLGDSRCGVVIDGTFPMSTATTRDSFTRPDSATLGTNWADWIGGGNSYRIISNRVGLIAPVTAHKMYYVPTNYGPEVDAYFELPVLPAVWDTFEVFARAVQVGASTFDAYAIAVNGSTWSAIRYDNAAPTTLGGTVSGPTPIAGDAIGIRCKGTTIEAWHRTGGTWSLILSRTDSTHTAAGKVGFGAAEGDLTWRIDTFAAGTHPSTIYSLSGTITARTSDRVFQASALTGADNLYQGGLLTWLTGNNAGASMEVRKWTLSTTTLELVLPMHGTVQVGDTFSIHAGCDKSHTTCFSKFNNIANFRGEPFVPQNKAIGVAEGRAPEQGGKK